MVTWITPLQSHRIWHEMEETFYSVNHLLALRTAQHPDYPVLGVPDKDLKYTMYTYKELNTAANLLAHHFVDSGLIPPRANGDTTSKLCIGLFAHSGYDYVVIEWALSRMGYSVLFISPNNSAPAVAHLLKSTNASHVVVQPVFDQTVKEASAILAEGGLSVTTVAQPDPQVYSTSSQANAPAEKLSWTHAIDYQAEQDHVAFIVHSSGSTGFPKPIRISHRSSVNNFVQNFNIKGLTTLPLYHNHGHSCFYRAIHSVKTLYLFPAATLPLTAGNIQGLLNSPQCEAQALFGVPYALKLLAESSEGIATLAKMKMVMYGGSPCPDELGDQLVQSGVNLVGHYGLTETGQLLTSFRDFANDKAWNYMRPNAYTKQYLRFEDRGDNCYELVVTNGFRTMTMSNRTDGSYATSDLFLKHSTVPDAYKFIGRLDDTLVLVNGEKTNPVPIELALRGESPYISEAIVFGAGRAQIGAIVLLSALVSTMTHTRKQLLDLISPAIKVANHSAPSHSQVAEETIVFFDFGTQIPRADKGSFLRPKVYSAFSKVIDDVYTSLEGGEEGEGKRKLSSYEESLELVTSTTRSTLGELAMGLQEETDLFEHGLDSLQSTRIRNALQRTVDINGAKLSTNFVFENPSLKKMAAHLLALSSGNLDALKEASQTEQMIQLVEKYRHFDVPAKVATSNGVHEPSANKTVVLTGTTGSLGASLLDQFLSDASVNRVYCLCRAKDDVDAARRTDASMRTRGLSALGNYKGLNDPRVVCLASDLSADMLGLQSDVHEEIARSVTLIIHNAWAVNFNLAIASFEPHIRGAVNLMKLGLASPYPERTSFYFSSSVSAVAGWKGPSIVPEQVTDDPAVAQNMGYARSKWVTEKLVEIAALTTPLRAGVLRIGQMVGDSRTGIWNETEAISLIFKSAETIQVLPALDEDLSWLPVDYAARTIMEVTSLPPSKTISCPCWHVVQPHQVHWTRDVLKFFSGAGLKFEAVPRREWLRRLRESDPDPVRNPTIKLLTFFEDKYDYDDQIVVKRSPLSTDSTQKQSPSLREAPAPDHSLIEKFVKAWRSTGFLH
ncbi:hypothetical protein FRC03_001374 [Tulasnella sp. 419]|nr:hypothetical protein FRC03_001374 [Tulasnella sp. 419]